MEDLSAEMMKKIDVEKKAFRIYCAILSGRSDTQGCTPEGLVLIAYQRALAFREVSERLKNEKQ